MRNDPLWWSAMGLQVRRYSRIMSRTDGEDAMDVSVAFSSSERTQIWCHKRIWTSGLRDMPNNFPFLNSHGGDVSLIVILKDLRGRPMPSRPLLSKPIYFPHPNLPSLNVHVSTARRLIAVSSRSSASPS